MDLVTITTPPGRLVSGDCFKPQTTDANGNPLIVKSGPNTGQPRTSFYIGVAIPKTDQGFNEIWAKMNQVARQSFPHLFDTSGNCLNPKFAWKYTDGDSQTPNDKGIKPYDREGYPGHWVLHFSNGFAPKCYTKGGQSIIINPEEIKRGYYVCVYATLKGNETPTKPGLYLNHSLIELVGYGKEIISGPDGAQVFGSRSVSLPAGASATPIAGVPINAPAAQPSPGMPSVPGGQPAPSMPSVPGGQPAPGMPSVPGGQPAPSMPSVPGGQPAPSMPSVPGGQPAPPAYDFLNPPSNIKFRTSDGGLWTEEQLKSAGWSTEQIAVLPRG